MERTGLELDWYYMYIVLISIDFYRYFVCIYFVCLYSTGPAIVQGCVQRFYLHYSGHLHYSEECLNSAGSALLRLSLIHI